MPALQGVSEAELYAVCTAHADTAQAAADKFAAHTLSMSEEIRLTRFSESASLRNATLPARGY